MDLTKSLHISAAGMKAQGTRLRTVAENLANSDSVADTPGGQPYRRKVVTFKNVLDRTLNAELVRVDRIRTDSSDFYLKFDPQHPAANADGYVQLPNVKPLVEMMDLREAQRSYEANLNVIDVAKGMLQRAIDILRS